MPGGRMADLRLKGWIAGLTGMAVLAGCSANLPEFHTRGLRLPSAECTVDPRSLGQVEKLEPFSKASGCGIPNPWRVRSLSGVELSRSATLNCGMVGALDDWVNGVAQPSAQASFGERITGIKVAASYACRARNGKRGTKLSEHGLGNAIDVAAFTLESGRVIEVEEGWRGPGDERAFLRHVNKGSCETFSTVLGPRHNHAHRNHFHLDMAQHGRKGDGRYCRRTGLPGPFAPRRYWISLRVCPGGGNRTTMGWRRIERSATVCGETR